VDPSKHPLTPQVVDAAHLSVVTEGRRVFLPGAKELTRHSRNALAKLVGFWLARHVFGSAGCLFNGFFGCAGQF
jgi:hypothetical protein